MRSGILRSAVSGSLVPQVSKEGTASELLSRLGPPPDTKVITAGKERRVPRGGKTGDVGKKPLVETMKRLGKPVTPELLFKAAGYDPDSVADVEKFYLELRDELGVHIRQTGTGDDTRVEVIPHAT
jgi:hypothetical protein